MAPPRTVEPVEQVPSAATREAARNWDANLLALHRTQPELAESLRLHDVNGSVAEWVYARDGALTAFTEPDAWWTGCSLPRRSAEVMLKTLEISGVVGCFLAPEHAAHLRVALDKLEPRQAVISVHSDSHQLALLLHCGDLGPDIAAGRLWFAAGQTWPDELRRTLETLPGLPTPSNFIRLPVTDAETIDHLVAEAQRVFSAETARRTGQLQRSRDGWRARPAAAVGPLRICAIAPSHFRLWDDAGSVLADVLEQTSPPDGSVECRRLDVDNPASASPLALAEAAAGCDAVVAANLSRADVPHVIPDQMPWMTWVTTPRVPPVAASGPADRLILCDAALLDAARGAGWAGDRIAVAAWPVWGAAVRAEAVPAGAPIAIIEDTRPLDPPEGLKDFSSHQLLWELIEQELRRDPLLSGEDINGFLSARMRKLGIADDGFDRRLFIDRLIVPARQHGIARHLLRAGLPVRLYGRGWDRIEDFKKCSTGAVSSRRQLEEAVAASALIVHTAVERHAHPLDVCGRPVVRACGRRPASLLDAVRRVLADPASLSARPAAAGLPPVSGAAVFRQLSGFSG